MLFTLVEIFYGWISHSLGLIGDGMHMFFDSSVILANLIVMFISSRKANENYTFGFGRSEAMAGFINALLLIYSAVSILIGALERVVHPHFEIHSEHLLSVSVIGLLVNLCGLLAFGHDHCPHSSKVHPFQAKDEHSNDCVSNSCDLNGRLSDSCNSNDCASDSCSSNNCLLHSCRSNDCLQHSCCSSSEVHHSLDVSSEPKQHNYIKEGMFMHVAVDALGSVAVIVSSLVIRLTGWIQADTLCSILLAFMIIWAVRPLLFDTFHVLLNGTPKEIASKLLGIRKELSTLNDRLNVADLKIWEHSSKEIYALFSGSCSEEVDLEALRLQIVSLLVKKLHLRPQFIFVELFQTK